MKKILNKLRLLRTLGILEFLLLIPLLFVFPRAFLNSLDIEYLLGILRAS